MKFIHLIFAIILSTQLIFSQEKFDGKYYVIPKSDTITHQLEEVVVTGTRTYQRAIDIPYSVVTMTNVDYKFDKKLLLTMFLDLFRCIYAIEIWKP